MNDEQYLNHCRELLSGFAGDMEKRTDSLEPDDSLRQLAAGFLALAGGGTADIYDKAGPLVSRLFTTYPDFAPTLPREVLWFLGGDCLHFMPDEEIALHQQLEELRHQAAARGETLDLQAARAKLLNLQ